MLTKSLIQWIKGNLKGHQQVVYLFRPVEGKIVRVEGMGGAELKVLKVLGKGLKL